MNEKDNFNVVVLFVPHLTAGARGGKVRIAYFQGGLAESEGRKSVDFLGCLHFLVWSL